MHFKIAHDFDATPEEFWAVFFDKDYNTELYQRLQMKERTVLEWKDTPEGVSFSQRIIPKRDLPAVVKKVVSGDLGYTENSTFVRAKNSMDVRITPTLFADRTKIAGRYWLEPNQDGKLRRFFEGDLNVKFAIFGGAIEKAIFADMSKSYDTAATVTAEWLARQRKAKAAE